MAFPTIAATNNSNESVVTTSHTVSLPADISEDDLLLVFFASDGDNTCTWSDDFIEIFEESDTGGKDAFLAVAYKYATGAEGGTITVTTTSNETSAHASYRITGHDSGQAPEVSTGVKATTDSPDPDSLTPTGGAKDYLWIAVEGNDDDDTTSAYPTNYNLSQINSTASDPGGCNLGVAGYNNNADAEDPGAFTISASEQTIACTIAVHPSTGVSTYTKDFTVDIHIQDTFNKEFIVDAYVQNTFTKEFTTDAILKAIFTKEYTTNALLQDTFTKDFTTDAVLSGESTKDFTINGILINVYTTDFTTDSILVNQYTKDFTIDASLSGEATKDFTVDSYLQGTFTKDFTTNAILTSVQTKDFTTDAVLRAIQTKDFTINGVIVNVNTKEFTTDAVLSSGISPTKEFTVNAYLEKELTKTFSVNSLLQDSFTKDFTIDSILSSAISYTKQFTIDALLAGGLTYNNYGTPFLYNLVKWGDVNFYLEVYMRAISGNAYARLYDETPNSEVTGSVLSTTSSSYKRKRSSALTLIDGHVYRIQFGKAGSDAGEFSVGKLIVI